MAAGGEGLDYWMRWQVLPCALIIVAPAAGAVAMIVRSRGEPLRAVDLWAPCWRKVHPLWLLGYRGLVFFAMSWLLYRYVVLYGRGISVLYFYTQWTFILVIIYFAIASLISAHGCWVYSKQRITECEEANGFLKSDFEQNRHATLTFRNNKNKDGIRLQSHHVQEVTEKRAGFWGYTMQIVYQTSAGAAVLTDVVFWGLLVPFLSSEHFSLNLVMGCMHSLNGIFLLLDTGLNNLPFPAFGMTYFVLWSCTYVTFQWVLHACGFSWWPYPFLELATPWAPLWYFCMALIHIPCYAVYWLIVKAKDKFLPRVFPDAFLRSS